LKPLFGFAPRKDNSFCPERAGCTKVTLRCANGVCVPAKPSLASRIELQNRLVLNGNVVETEARVVAERVLSALTDRDAFRLQLRASVGVGWQESASGDGKLLIRRADQAMYRAKASGGGTAAT
jgi:GGDEF domain-containing protein